MIADDRRRSSAIEIAGDRGNRTMFYSCDRLRSVAIVCDRVRSYVNKVLRSCDWNVSHNAMFSQRQHYKRHDTMTTSCLSTFTRACVLRRWKVKLTRNSLWKKLENAIVCSIVLAKNSKKSSRRLSLVQSRESFQHFPSSC